MSFWWYDDWMIGPPANQVRDYHSVALLLPDGRVWTHGGNEDGKDDTCAEPSRQLNVDIFEPWYYGRDDRPVITSAPETMVPDGREYTIGVDRESPWWKVSLVRLGSVTHGVNTDQRLIWLHIVDWDSDRVIVRAPYSAAAAPPGFYMLFVLRWDGWWHPFLPSEATMVRVLPPALIVPFIPIGPLDYPQPAG